MAANENNKNYDKSNLYLYFEHTRKCELYYAKKTVQFLDIIKHVWWFVGAHRFSWPSCLATVVKPGQGLVMGTMLFHLSVKCPGGSHLDST